MKTSVRLSLQKIAKRLALLAVGTVMFLGLLQPAVQATPIPTEQSTTQDISSDELAQKRAERRAKQSRASQLADTEKSQDKLNLGEIAEENVLTNEGNGVPDELGRNKATENRLK